MMSLKLLMIITKTVCGVFALACNVIKLFELLVAINQAYWSMDLDLALRCNQCDYKFDCLTNQCLITNSRLTSDQLRDDQTGENFELANWAW